MKTVRVLTAAEMGAVDRRTADDFGVPLEQLMQRAGAAVATFCKRRFPQCSRPLVVCGKGNNGGDGLVAARNFGPGARVLLLEAEASLNADATRELARLRQEQPGIEVFVAALQQGTTNTPSVTFTSAGASGDAGAPLEDLLRRCDLVVDAIVGTGFRPPLRGAAEIVRDVLREPEFAALPVVSVDMPSGWDADSEQQDCPEAFRSDAVVTFTAPKRAHVFGHLTSRVFGPVVVTEIGSPEDAIQSASDLHWAGASKSIAESPRNINSNKGKFGHLLVIAGSHGKSGAAAMASLSALRTGAGLVTAAVPVSVVESVARITPELMVMPLAESDGSLALENVKGEALERMLKGIKVVAIGPGLGTRGDVPEFVRTIVTECTLPLVIDADALNCIAGNTQLLRGVIELARETGQPRTIVLTPHPGEMARLVGMSVPEVEADRIGIARRFATEHGVTLVLKGWRTLIAHPDGRMAVNTTGNPSMAKGGSGDILTGIVAAMLAQYAGDVASTVEAAVYLHGLAADLCVARGQDEHTVLATDTVAHLSGAFRYRVRDEDGFTWITGIHTEEVLHGR